MLGVPNSIAGVGHAAKKKIARLKAIELTLGHSYCRFGYMRTATIRASDTLSIWTCSSRSADVMGLLGILVGLVLLIWLAFRGWSVLLLAPAAALLAALFGGEPLLANWTQIFMGGAALFLA